MAFGSEEWKKLQEKFLDIAFEKVNQMKNALLTGDLSLIQNYAHQLKGSGTSYGFPEITEISAQIEAKCILNSCDQVREFVEKLHDLIEKLRLGT